MLVILLNDRVQWIDSAKGIGIAFVVLIHIWLLGEGYIYLSSFLMPLFFFLSGYVADIRKYDGIKQFILVKINKIVIPYFIFSFISYIYWFLIERKFSGNLVSPTIAFTNIFTCPGGDTYLPHNPALWFLPCLFAVTVIFHTIMRRINNRGAFFLLVASCIMGYFTSLYVPDSVPWSIDVVPTGIVFYGTGFIMGKNKKVKIKSFYIRALIVGCCVPTGFIIAQLNGYVDMADNLYGNYFYFYLAAFAGIINIVIVAVIFRKNKILTYWGQNSLIILALHFPVKRVVMGLSSKVFNISLEQIKGSLFMSGIDTIITMLLLVPIIYVVSNYCKFILGKRVKDDRLRDVEVMIKEYF